MTPQELDRSDCLVVLCTCPDRETAGTLARGLLEARLAACVNLLDGCESVYRWHGEIATDREVLMLVKTTRDAFEPLRDALVAAHPYELPEVIGVPIEAGLGAYLDWIAEAVQPAASSTRQSSS